MLQARKVGAGIPSEVKYRPDAAQEAVMQPRRNCIFRTGAILSWALMAALVGAGTLRAQSPDIAKRLPLRTVAFVEWRGTSVIGGDAQQNHVLQMMADPAMTPLWLGLAADFQKSQQKSKAPVPPLSLPEEVSLLQNPMAAGIIETPHAAEASSTAKPASPVAVFLVYDATGKAEIIEKLEAAETRGPNASAVTHFDFDGTTVEARTFKENTTYFAMAGRYFVSSDKKAVIEDLIMRYGTASTAADSVAQRPEYAEVRKFIGSDAAVDYFARVPNLKEWIAVDAKDKHTASAMKFINGLHLEKVHAMGGSVSFAGEAMRVRGAMMGDTKPVGPFDFAGASGASFHTLAIAGGAPEFTVSRINFGALYRLLLDAVGAVLPPQQAATVQSAQGMAQGFLGMPIPDALGLFTGEVASASSFSGDGAQERVFAATIQKPDAVLRILRAVLGPMTLAEDSSGDTTTLDIAYPYRDPLTGFTRRKLYYVAVTPQLLLVAPRKAMLRETIAGLRSPADSGAAAPAGKGIFSDPEYSKMRALLPEKLSGLGAENLAQIPWEAVWAHFEQQAGQLSKQTPHASKTAYSPAYSWMKLVNPAVIPRHLHMAVSGWWKDASGVYFDAYVQ
jgi:hypothetical protein